MTHQEPVSAVTGARVRGKVVPEATGKLVPILHQSDDRPLAIDDVNPAIVNLVRAITRLSRQYPPRKGESGENT